MALALDLLEADFWDVPFVAAAQQKEERIHYMRRFNLHTFTKRQCLDFFRFKSEQLVHLCRCLRIPHKMTAANGTNASGEKKIVLKPVEQHFLVDLKQRHFRLPVET